MSATAYIVEGEKLRCPRHHTVFAKTSACAGCVLEPGIAPEDEPIVVAPPPPGCMSTTQAEEAAVELYRQNQWQRSKLTAGKMRKGRNGQEKEAEPVLDLHAHNTLAKLTDTGLKALRLIHDIAARREDESVQRERERRKKELDGDGSH